MQRDTRYLTVARDHLTSALDGLRRARSLNERSLIEAAARRALDLLHLAWRRLDEERARAKRKDIVEPAELAYRAAHAAWQQVCRKEPALDDSQEARTKQMIWELVSPLFDRLDQLQHDVRELRQRVQACEAGLKNASSGSMAPSMLPLPRSDSDAG